MARNNSNIDKANRNIRRLAQGISGGMNDLYRSTYMSTPQHSDDLKDLNSRINASIDNIVNRNMETVGVPSVSKLYSRIAASKQDSKIAANLEKMFDDGLITDDLYGLFMSNRFLKELDNEIDTVCKYMPKLEEALQVQRDCVLSADHFSKDFITLNCPSSGETDGTVFSERAKDIKAKYQLSELVDEIYEDTSKYGEKFIYRVPYSIAIGRLLSTKPDGALVAPTRGMHESYYDEEDSVNEFYVLDMDKSNVKIISESGSKVLSESASILTESVKIKDGKEVTTPVSTSVLSDKERFRIGLEICKSGIIESAVLETKKAYDKKVKFTSRSLSNIHEQSVREQSIIREDADSIEAKGNINLGKNKLDDRMVANDGLIRGDKPEIVKVKAPGCVVKKLARENVVPIYIEDICMGYYYFELRTVDDSESFMGFKNILGVA